MDDSESGRVKGSIKDRVLSFLYRKRLKIKLMKKKQLIKKETRVKIAYIKKSKINSFRDLKKLGDKVIPVDVKKEHFDFEKYDYYIIEPVKKKGIDTEELKKVNNKKEIIKQSEKICNEIRKDIKSMEINLNYPKEHQEDLEEKLKCIKNNIQKLQTEFQKLDIKNVALLNIELALIKKNKESLKMMEYIIDQCENELAIKKNNIKIVETISNIKFKKNVGINKPVQVQENIGINKPVQVQENKNNKKDSIKLDEEKEKINHIKLYKVNKKLLKEKKIDSKKTIKVLNKFDGARIRQLKNNETQIEKEVDVVKEIIDDMNKEVDKVTKEISEVTKTTGYSKVIKSCLKIATGILTLPFNGFNIFNITLGSALINKGLNGLRKGLETKSEIKIDYKYEDLSKKIKETKDKTKLTELLIMDSLAQINSIKQSTYLGEKNIEMLNNLENKLSKKLKEIDKLNNKLSNQDERNKIKIRKVEKQQY